MFDVCVLGSVNLDIVVDVDRLPNPGETLLGSSYAEHPGGKGLNQAIAAARAGADVVFVGSVGDDAPGGRLADVLAHEGVDVERLVRRADVPTGRALIAVADDGQNTIVVVPGANSRTVVGGLPPARVVLAQLEIPLEVVAEALAAARAAGATTVLNPAPATQLDPSLVACCDLIVPNEHEVELLGGVDRLRRDGARDVVVTLGKRGARWIGDAGAVAVAPFPVEPVDTTAAGDAFCGTLAARLAAGLPMAAALRSAAAAGALATTRAGAAPSIPTGAEVDALVARGGDRAPGGRGARA